MSRPADVDRMVSSFLSELDTLSDSLGVTPGGAADDARSLHAQDQAPESNGKKSEEVKSAPNPDHESPAPAISNGMPCRNIDILLMTDNRYLAGARRNREEFFRMASVLQDAGVPAFPQDGQTRRAKPALYRLRFSLSWPPVTAWIRKLLRPGSDHPADS